MIKRHGIRVVNTSSLEANLVAVGKSCLSLSFRGRKTPGIVIFLSFMTFSPTALQCLYNANPSDSSELCSQKWIHSWDSTSEMLFSAQFERMKCFQTSIDVTHQSSPLTAPMGNFSARSPSPLAELIINSPPGDKRHSVDREISSGWLFS